MPLKIFGRNPSGERLEKIQSSPNYKNNLFQNLSATPVMSPDASYPKMMKNFFSPSKNGSPSKPVPYVKTDLKNIKSDKPVIVWFGHSSYFIRINGKNILVDPVLSGSASPFSFMVRAFEGTNEYKVDDFPEIDLLLLTHDHYDHLDYKTVCELKPKVKTIYCSLGVGAHLEFWGFDPAGITEFDWCDKQTFGEDIEITAAPARHFSGRMFERGKTLWSSFILRTKNHNLFLGGDSGYDAHFKKIGDQYGPFDLAILESGQYNTFWPLIHMMPEETVQAAVDLNATILLPVHWGKFKLAMHSWNEPIIRVVKKAAELNVKVAFPLIGEPLILGSSLPDKQWWNF